MKSSGIMVFNVDTPSFALSTVTKAADQMSSLFNHVYFYQVTKI